MANTKELIDTKKAAERLGVSVRRVRALVEGGRIREVQKVADKYIYSVSKGKPPTVLPPKRARK